MDGIVLMLSCRKVCNVKFNRLLNTPGGTSFSRFPFKRSRCNCAILAKTLGARCRIPLSSRYSVPQISVQFPVLISVLLLSSIKQHSSQEHGNAPIHLQVSNPETVPSARYIHPAPTIHPLIFLFEAFTAGTIKFEAHNLIYNLMNEFKIKKKETKNIYIYTYPDIYMYIYVYIYTYIYIHIYVLTLNQYKITNPSTNKYVQYH